MQTRKTKQNKLKPRKTRKENWWVRRERGGEDFLQKGGRRVRVREKRNR